MMQRERTNRTDVLIQLFGLLAVAVVMVGVYMAFVYAPTDRDQGHAQRIFYIHVPMAWLAYLSIAVVFVGSVGYMWKRSARMDRLARSSAELGFLFTTLVLITGSLWGRPIWNTWWQWEARLTTTLILWFIFIGYFMVRSYAGDRERGARYAAVLGIIGAVDVPIIHQSVTWWRTLHPEPVVVDTTGPNLPNSMLVTMLVSLVGFMLIYIYLMIQKTRIETVRDHLAERELTALLEPDPKPEQLPVEPRTAASIPGKISRAAED